MRESFWRKIGRGVLGKDAMEVIDRTQHDKRHKAQQKAPGHLKRKSSTVSDQSFTDQKAPRTEVEKAAFSAIKKLDQVKKDGISLKKNELIRAARAIHRGRQAALGSLDPTTRNNLQDLAKKVFGVKE